MSVQSFGRQTCGVKLQGAAMCTLSLNNAYGRQLVDGKLRRDAMHALNLMEQAYYINN